jgi:hypothetical protein
MKLQLLTLFIGQLSSLVVKSNLRYTYNMCDEAKKISKNSVNLKDWTGKGHTIPTCINDGCTNSVAIRHWSAQGDPSLKTECSRCSDARKKDNVI